jgi:hypothetical protein
LTEIDSIDPAGAGRRWGTGICTWHIRPTPKRSSVEPGIQLMQRDDSGALLVSAGGNHHHIGFNTWAGVGAPPAPPAAIRLRDFAVRLLDERVRAAIVDRSAPRPSPSTQQMAACWFAIPLETAC